VDVETIERERREIEQTHGPWTAHNVRLAPGVYTIGEQPAGDEVKLRRVTQVVLDLCGGDVSGARVLDLACLEGMYSLELARRGAEVVAIEGREANVAKARFAARALGLDVDFRIGDVRDLAREQHGEFDVVLCLGILYHLDAADLFPFVERMSEVCRRALVVDTHVSVRDEEQRTHHGHVYGGHTLVEHAPDATEEERLRAVWSSLDNPQAFALTKPSLLRLLARNGFTSVHETHVPAEPEKTLDRATLVALKGRLAGELLTPEPPTAAGDVRERPPLSVRLVASRAWSVGRAAVPPPLRARLRQLLRVETRRY
jgi:2-polyprenyl-3-methyl-5-hydroxy-6-metoxy-1,4-benzoquinol methylase